MQRRKFIAGMGSLAAAGAAVVGSGAFTSVQADRSVDVEVAGDANAYLSIQKDTDGSGTVTDNAQQYVTESNGEVSLNFDDDNPTNEGGQGINDDSVTIFDDLFRVTNQGTQTVIVGHQQDFAPADGALYHEDYEDSQNTRVGDSPEYSITGTPDNNGTNLDTIALKNLPVLEPGDELDAVGFFVTPDGGNSPGSTFIDGTITFTAAAEPADLPGSPSNSGSGNSPPL